MSLKTLFIKLTGNTANHHIPNDNDKDYYFGTQKYNPYAKIIQQRKLEKKKHTNFNTLEIQNTYELPINTCLNAIVLADVDYIEDMTYAELMRIRETDNVNVLILLGDIRDKFIENVSETLPNTLKIGVLGNHDYYGQLEKNNVNNLHSNLTEVKSINFAGLEGSWKYKDVDYPSFTQEEAISKCKHLPRAEILISHNSPFGIHESDRNAHQGFKGINKYIESHNPKLVLHGHQHRNLITQLPNGTVILGIFGVAHIKNSALTLL